MGSKVADLILRTELRPGDLGAIVMQHGLVYAAEYGLDATFEPYVAKALAEFCMPGTKVDFAHHASPGRVWIAYKGETFAGSIGICRTHRAREAQLRWFLVMPTMRGTGLGPKLLDEALAHCRSEGLQDVYLWTFDRLHAAMKLYARAGFIETARSTHAQWGETITEVRMDLKIA
jgi:GNAT superfamily N-acetyltransferase